MVYCEDDDGDEFYRRPLAYLFRESTLIPEKSFKVI
jgi:hypothetical protein